MNVTRVVRAVAVSSVAAVIPLAGGMVPAAALSYSANALAVEGHSVLLTPWLIAGGSGNFQVVSDACVDVAVSGRPVPAGAAGLCALNAAGVYTSVVCGTATMNGAMNVAGDALNFTIVMVSGIQVLTGQVTAGPDTGDTVAGAFYVIATVPSNPPGCVNGYDFAGALSL